MTYRGRIEQGRVVLEGSVSLPEGAAVTVTVATQPESADDDGDRPTLLERLKHFKGTAKNLPPDASKNVDHYLYGLPKK